MGVLVKVKTLQVFLNLVDEKGIIEAREGEILIKVPYELGTESGRAARVKVNAEQMTVDMFSPIRGVKVEWEEPYIVYHVPLKE